MGRPHMHSNTGTAPCYSALLRDRKRYGIWILSYELKLKPRLHSLGKSHFCRATAIEGEEGKVSEKHLYRSQASALRQGLWPVHSSMTWRDDQPIHPMFCCIWPFTYLGCCMSWMYRSSVCAEQCLRQNTLPASISLGLWYGHPINQQESLSPGRTITSSSILSMADLSWQDTDIVRGLSLPYSPHYL